jgi:hypothetical protein
MTGNKMMRVGPLETHGSISYSSTGQIDADIVKVAHFKGFSDDEGDNDDDENGVRAL